MLFSLIQVIPLITLLYKVKLSLLQSVEKERVVRRRGSHIT
jgi:hypothetical protein